MEPRSRALSQLITARDGRISPTPLVSANHVAANQFTQGHRCPGRHRRCPGRHRRCPGAAIAGAPAAIARATVRGTAGAGAVAIGSVGCRLMAAG